MPELTIEQALEYLRRLAHERPDAKYPRVAGNPYGDNALGRAFDEGWWAGLKYFRDRAKGS